MTYYSADTRKGFCQCGCGERTKVSRWSDASVGYVKGEPRRFLRGHWKKLGPEYIVDANGCWVWQLAKISTGYGVRRRDGKNVLAHRTYYEEHIGPIPEGLHIDHLCRNRACVNPDHLEPVPQAINNRRGCNVRLTAESAQSIRESPLSTKELAELYDVSVSAVYCVRAGQSWVPV